MYKEYPDDRWVTKTHKYVYNDVQSIWDISTKLIIFLEYTLKIQYNEMKKKWLAEGNMYNVIFPYNYPYYSPRKKNLTFCCQNWVLNVSKT